jgi:GNAT superfamily N-acetyltransferase
MRDTCPRYVIDDRAPSPVRLPAPEHVPPVRRLGAMRVLRPTPDRFDETLDVLRGADIAVYGASDWTASDLRDEWDELDGRIAGVAHLLDRKGGRFIGDGYVHPELTGRGVGDRVLDLLETRVLELQPDGPRTVGSSSRPRTLPATRVRPSSSADVASSACELLPDGRRHQRGTAGSRVARRRRAPPARRRAARPAALRR